MYGKKWKSNATKAVRIFLFVSILFVSIYFRFIYFDLFSIDLFRFIYLKKKSTSLVDELDVFFLKKKKEIKSMIKGEKEIILLSSFFFFSEDSSYDMLARYLELQKRKTQPLQLWFQNLFSS